MRELWACFSRHFFTNIKTMSSRDDQNFCLDNFCGKRYQHKSYFHLSSYCDVTLSFLFSVHFVIWSRTPPRFLQSWQKRFSLILTTLRLYWKGVCYPLSRTVWFEGLILRQKPFLPFICSAIKQIFLFIGEKVWLHLHRNVFIRNGWICTLG